MFLLLKFIIYNWFVYKFFFIRSFFTIHFLYGSFFIRLLSFVVGVGNLFYSTSMNFILSNCCEFRGHRTKKIIIRYPTNSCHLAYPNRFSLVNLFSCYSPFKLFVPWYRRRRLDLDLYQPPHVRSAPLYCIYPYRESCGSGSNGVICTYCLSTLYTYFFPN